MYKLYLVGLIGLTLFLCFLAGEFRGNAKCKEEFAEKTIENLKNNQIIYENQRKEIDEKVFSTSLHDIRRILREKYTIAD